VIRIELRDQIDHADSAAGGNTILLRENTIMVTPVC
jgi:hypothetical protein